MKSGLVFVAVERSHIPREVFLQLHAVSRLREVAR
jgi:hypothetical protein